MRPCAAGQVRPAQGAGAATVNVRPQEAIEVLAVCADGRRRPGPTGSRPERLRFTAAAAGDVSASNSAERVSARIPSVCVCVRACVRVCIVRVYL